jgi:hypothetical protein
MLRFLRSDSIPHHDFLTESVDLVTQARRPRAFAPQAVSLSGTGLPTFREPYADCLFRCPVQACVTGDCRITDGKMCREALPPAAKRL